MGLIPSFLQAAGEYQDGQDQAQTADTNRFLADMSASDAVRRGEDEAGRARMAATAAIGEQRVAAGASGIDATTGTAAELEGDARMLSTLDQQRIRSNALREAWGYKVESFNYGREAQQARRRAGFRAASTVLGGMAQQGQALVGVAGGH